MIENTNININTYKNRNRQINKKIKLKVQKNDEKRTETLKKKTITMRKINIINNKNFIKKNIKDLHNASITNNKNKPELKKTLNTCGGQNPKKFNEEEFQKLMKNFDNWEKKRKDKIEKLKKEKEEELKLIKVPETNKEENLKFNTNPKKYDIVERLYIQDITKKRR